MNAAIQFEHTTHVYVTRKQATLAVEEIDFAVQPGEFVSLIGPSGCGKTTILSMASGLLAPSAGRVHLFGEQVAGPSIKVGYMLQQDYLFPWRSIYENAIIGLELRGRATKEGRDYVMHLLEEMGLASYKDYAPQQLSGGMRQRVALVRTLATEPDILLLDEPFSALDYQTKLQLEDLVAATLKAKGKTALLVTHDISEAIAMSDRVLIMQPRPGRIRRELKVPERIRQELPFTAREQAGFHELLRGVWNEFDG